MKARPDTPDHGPTLSRREFERRIVALHRNAPEKPLPDEETSLERAELDLLIDYRLGTQFPGQRREQLWQLKQQHHSSRLQSLLFVFSQVLVQLNATRIANRLLREYRKVLTPAEFEAFFHPRKDE